MAALANINLDPTDVDHSPHVHPAAPSESLPESFAQYRGRAQQHGPLGGAGQRQAPSAGTSKAFEVEPYGAIGGHSGHELGSVQPAKGEVWDRDELPARFRRKVWSQREIEAIDSAGASLWG